MTKEQVLAQQRADFAVAKFIEEILGSGHIKECTFGNHLLLHIAR